MRLARFSFAVALLILPACDQHEKELAKLRADLKQAQKEARACGTELQEVRDVAYAVSQEPCFQACARERKAEIIRRNENESRAKHGLPPRPE